MTTTLPGWEPRLASYVEGLTRSGHLRDPVWIDAFASVPRHLFTPAVILGDPDGYRILRDTPHDHDEWLSRVYSDESLVTQDRPHPAGYRLPSGQPLRVPTSSSTMPSLMARMLEALDIHTGHRVLEIGTGTGYNAALLCQRLGSAAVTSIDIDAGLVGQAGHTLASLGYTPTLLVGDGAAGIPHRGCYDRILATAAVPDIPDAWINQLAPGGKILVNLRGELSGAHLCLLTKEGHDQVTGPLLALGGHFMWLRSKTDPDRGGEHLWVSAELASVRILTTRDPATLPIDADGFRFLLQAQLPGARALFRGHQFDPATRAGAEAVTVTTSDGSRASAFTDPDSSGRYRVLQSGPRRLWDTLLGTLSLWRTLGEPTPDRFNITASPDAQYLRLDNDPNWSRWPLPLA